MDTIELRRYPSRKIYNKTASRYIKLPEVAELIKQGHNVRIEDTETGEDVTRPLLLQIIIDQESDNDQPILSSSVLTEMIRAHQSKASEVMTDLFDSSFAFMRQQQERMAKSVPASLVTPWAAFDPAVIEQTRREFNDRIAGFWGLKKNTDSQDAPAATDAQNDDEDVSSDIDELQSLKQRLEKLEQKMST